MLVESEVDCIRLGRITAHTYVHDCLVSSALSSPREHILFLGEFCDVTLRYTACLLLTTKELNARAHFFCTRRREGATPVVLSSEATCDRNKIVWPPELLLLLITAV